MLNGEERRQEMMSLIKQNEAPLSGAELAAQLKVSRQVIVQDIALLRAKGVEILSTNRGYVLLHSPKGFSRVFRVIHQDAEIADELNSIVDAGGKVIDVFIKHPVYGEIKAPIQAYYRNDVKEFIQKMHSGEGIPLKNMTAGEHFHTVEAYSEEILDEVESVLRQKGYLVP